MRTNPWMWAAAAVVAWLLFRRVMGGSKVASSVVVEKIKSGAKIVDVRSQDEFIDGSYPGAVNIPVGSLGGRLAEIPRDRPVVLFCASGARSAAAARLLRQAGYADVVNAGGLSDMPA